MADQETIDWLVRFAFGDNVSLQDERKLLALARELQDQIVPPTQDLERRPICVGDKVVFRDDKENRYYDPERLVLGGTYTVRSCGEPSEYDQLIEVWGYGWALCAKRFDRV